jgi:hypothetical protein
MDGRRRRRRQRMGRVARRGIIVEGVRCGIHSNELL